MSSSRCTGLCLLAKRADTGAVYSLLNHPGSRDFAQRSTNLIDWASQIPSMLLRNGRTQSQHLLRQLTHELSTGSPGEKPSARPLGGTAQLTYARFDVGLDQAWLSELGLSELASRARSLQVFDDPGRLSDYIALGRAAASRQIKASHFPANFDPDFQSADSPNPTRTPRKRAEAK